MEVVKALELPCVSLEPADLDAAVRALCAKSAVANAGTSAGAPAQMYEQIMQRVYDVRYRINHDCIFDFTAALTLTQFYKDIPRDERARVEKEYALAISVARRFAVWAAHDMLQYGISDINAAEIVAQFEHLRAMDKPAQLAFVRAHPDSVRIASGNGFLFHCAAITHPRPFAWKFTEFEYLRAVLENVALPAGDLADKLRVLVNAFPRAIGDFRFLPRVVANDSAPVITAPVEYQCNIMGYIHILNAGVVTVNLWTSTTASGPSAALTGQFVDAQGHKLEFFPQLM